MSSGQNLSFDVEHDYCPVEEVVSAVTHAIGGYLGAAAIVLLVMFAVASGEQVAWKVVSGSIFGASIVVLYSASLIYHAVANLRIKEICRVCDQMAIYILIAGSYTPFCLVSLRQDTPALAWTVFGFVWGATVFGIVFKSVTRRQHKYVTTATYLAMGWCSLFVLKPLGLVLGVGGMVWLILGGVLYSLGIIFFLWRKLPFNHAIWHLFVLAGTICHFFCILFYVMMS